MSDGLVLADAPRSKYHARRVTVDGLAFDSRSEADRWCELRLLCRAGEIQRLRRQVICPLSVVSDGETRVIGNYVVDFVYEERDSAVGHTIWWVVFEEHKGAWTPLAQWKRKHFEAQYRVTLRITTPRR